MQLPGNRVGISDINDYQECPKRFEFSMRRWTEAGEAPEAFSRNNAYGSIFHYTVHLIESERLSDNEAIQRAFDKYGTWLDPTDLEQLVEDLTTYHERDYVGVELVGSELDLSMPLFTTADGTEIRFRGQIDRLYRRIDNPGIFIAIDYKSSAHPKSEEEVHADKQQWAYNVLVHDFYPECETLIQQYDQLRFGRIPTSKTDAQRATMRAWLIHQVQAILADEELKPKLNDWCGFCPLLPSCEVIPQLSEYALAEIAAIAPEEKNGRRTDVKLDPDLIEVYVDELKRATKARGVLERFEKAVKKTLLNLPAGRRQELGYKTTTRGSDVFSARAMQAIHAEMGDEFYEAVSITKTTIERAFKDEPDRKERILQLADRVQGSPSLTRTDRS